MTSIEMACKCGIVKGKASGLTPKTVNHAVCYCDDCQAFARFLGRGDDVLDEYGGTDIFQMAPKHLTLTQGTDQLRCMQLSEKGIHRWYTACCKTPVGNTAGAGLPFVGVIHSFLEKDREKLAAAVPIDTYVHLKFAVKPVPEEIKAKAFSGWKMIPFILKLLGWRLRGWQKPSPFYGDDSKPVARPFPATEGPQE